MVRNRTHLWPFHSWLGKNSFEKGYGWARLACIIIHVGEHGRERESLEMRLADTMPSRISLCTEKLCLAGKATYHVAKLSWIDTQLQ